MLKVRLSKDAASFLEKIPSKHAKQIAQRIVTLQSDPAAYQTEELKGYAPYRRLKAGEYRVIFFIETEVINITLIGKRNDDDIYKQVKKLTK